MRRTLEEDKYRALPKQRHSKITNPSFTIRSIRALEEKFAHTNVIPLYAKNSQKGNIGTTNRIGGQTQINNIP
jgi:hypothetical protein